MIHPVRCTRHGVMFVDVLNAGGDITHECPDCSPVVLVLVDVVKQLHRRSSEMAAAKKAIGA